jgi:hypothetical protein
MRKLNASRLHRERVSNQSQYYTPAELRHARLSLASEMVDLVLSDTDALPQAMQETLAGLATVLGAVLKDARGHSTRPRGRPRRQ